MEELEAQEVKVVIFPTVVAAGATFSRVVVGVLMALVGTLMEAVFSIQIQEILSLMVASFLTIPLPEQMPEELVIMVMPMAYTTMAVR